jgi:hypothetical protein
MLFSLSNPAFFMPPRFCFQNNAISRGPGNKESVPFAEPHKQFPILYTFGALLTLLYPYQEFKVPKTFYPPALPLVRMAP